MMITLSRVGTNEDGDLCTTHRTVEVTRDKMERFTRVGISIEALIAVTRFPFRFWHVVAKRRIILMEAFEYD